MNKTRTAAEIGIAGVSVYFASVALFIATKYEWALTLWEIMTVVGAALELAVLTIFADKLEIRGLYRTFMLISLSGMAIITSVAHITSIGAVRKLAADGVAVPDWLKIGKFPSIEMSMDYTAWGLFMGAAFLFFFLGTKVRSVKIISLIITVLCFTGFIGSFFAESLWYPAPMGYGFGFLILCICFLKKNRGLTSADI